MATARRCARAIFPWLGLDPFPTSTYSIATRLQCSDRTCQGTLRGVRHTPRLQSEGATVILLLSRDKSWLVDCRSGHFVVSIAVRHGSSGRCAAGESPRGVERKH
jgi:hypothetical protein